MRTSDDKNTTNVCLIETYIDLLVMTSDEEVTVSSTNSESTDSDEKELNNLEQANR